MSEFKQPLTPLERGWIELRERYAHAARELHFSAVASDAANGPTLLVITGNLAGLALSIPMRSTPTQRTSGGLVDASILFAAQILQRDMQTDDDATGVNESISQSK